MLTDMVTDEDAPAQPTPPQGGLLASVLSNGAEVLTNGAEVLIAFAAAALMIALATSIDVDPLDRIGQVSGLAALQLRFTLLTCLLLAIMALTARIARLGGERTHLTSVRMSCAALSGLVGGFLGGGVMVALHGTHYGLCANGGDAAVLQSWATQILAGQPSSPTYPPGAPHILAWLIQLSGQPAAYAFKLFEVGGVACVPVAAYLGWRRLLPPLWALGIGVIATLPLIHPYKPNVTMVLSLLIPCFAILVARLRQEQHGWRKQALAGLGYGFLFALLFLTYSGWFMWSAPGALAVLLLAVPWRAPGRGARLILLGTAALMFVLLAHRHLLGTLAPSKGITDRFFYFDVYTNPAYVVGWLDNMPGALKDAWPPYGELAGVGLFTILVAVTLGFAIAWGWQVPAVLVSTAFAGGAWLLRFWVAAGVYKNQAVQLYPRTTAEIFYCLLILAGFSAYLGHERWRKRQAVPGARAPMEMIGAFVALAFLFGSAGSAIADRFMPADDNSVGMLAWYAHTTKQLDGSCARYTTPGRAGTPEPNSPADWRACKPISKTPVGHDSRRETGR